jgi:hypothetical protein
VRGVSEGISSVLSELGSFLRFSIWCEPFFIFLNKYS